MPPEWRSGIMGGLDVGMFRPASCHRTRHLDAGRFRLAAGGRRRRKQRGIGQRLLRRRQRRLFLVVPWCALEADGDVQRQFQAQAEISLSITTSRLPSP
jgi:hypothetical protein